MLHNGSTLTTSNNDGEILLTCHTFDASNCLEICATVDIKLNDISMFDLGTSKLVYLGHCATNNQQIQSQVIPQGSIWSLGYSAPVFSWLHLVLNHGWLVGP